MRGKTALITGSTSGIGAGIAEVLAERGVDVMLNGFGDAESIEQQRRTLAQTHGVRVLYDPADMGQPSQIAQLITRTEQALGRLDILVCNAGIQHVSPIETFEPSRWDAVIAVNLSAAFHAMQAAIPGMKQRGWGRIINIASVHGLVASPNKAAYVAAKHGLIGLTKVAALELAGTGITANAICPGWVLTPLVQSQFEARAANENRPVAEVQHEILSEKQPLAQFSTPRQIGVMVAYLSGDDAQTLTGTSLSIDGGWSAQ